MVKKSFFDHRPKAFNMLKGKRRVFPKKSHEYPIAGYYGKVMGYIESRKKIYCPYYEELLSSIELTLVHHPKIRKPYDALTELIQMHLSRINLLIVGYDGRDVPMTKKGLMEAVNDTKYPFGHELVICCILLNMRVWLEK